MTTFWAAVLAGALWAAPAGAAERRHPPGDIDISTVSAHQKKRINEQPLKNDEYSVRDASLKGSAVGSGYTLIPLPAFVYNRNEGAWAGLLTPLFRANSLGQVEDIFAPLYLHNELIGETFTLNYFGYRTGTKQFHAIVSKATKVERTIDLSYKDIAAGPQGRYIVFLQANAGKSAFNRFYGFGAKTEDRLETNYAMGDSNVRLCGGVNVSDALAVLAVERYRFVNIENGVVHTLPQTLSSFPTAPGLDGETLWAQGLTFQYDTRDNQLTPLRGTFATVVAEWNRNFETNNVGQWWRVTSEYRTFVPHFKDRGVFVFHALLDALPIDSRGLVPNGVPFFERPTLGGESTLRAFGRGRYVSSFAVLFNFEERVSLLQRSIMGDVVELEAAPFVDVGRVGRFLGSNSVLQDVQVNPGVGVRVLARPNIASRLDVATGRDGTSVFVGLDYPF